MFANDQAFVEIDLPISCYTQSSSMTLMQYAVDLYGKSCKVVDDLNESLVRDDLIEEVDCSIAPFVRDLKSIRS